MESPLGYLGFGGKGKIKTRKEYLKLCLEPKVKLSLTLLGDARQHEELLKKGVHDIGIDNLLWLKSQNIWGTGRLARKRKRRAISKAIAALTGPDKIYTSIIDLAKNDNWLRFDRAHLDFCGQYSSKSTLESLKAFASITAKEGKFIITLKCGRESCCPKGTARKDINGTIVREIMDALKEVGVTATLIFPYHKSYTGKAEYEGKLENSNSKMHNFYFGWTKI